MEIKYRIIEIDQTQHSIIVRYYTDAITQDDLATSFHRDDNGNMVIARRPDGTPERCQTDYNINVWQTNPAPTIEEIHIIAKNAAPFDWFKIKQDVLNPEIDTTLSNVTPIIGQEFTVKQSLLLTGPDPDISTMNDLEINQLINSIINNPSSNTGNT